MGGGGQVKLRGINQTKHVFYLPEIFGRRHFELVVGFWSTVEC